jgi:mono/diheme cytochrome c family protein
MNILKAGRSACGPCLAGIGRPGWIHPLLKPFWLACVLLCCISTRVFADVPTPRQFYQNHCANCHGADGRGARLRVAIPAIPDFTNPQWQAVHTKAGMEKILLKGKGAMPGYKGDLQGLTANEVIRYLRTFARKNHPDSTKTKAQPDEKDPPAQKGAQAGGADPPTAELFYKDHCANCHGADGRGTRLRVAFPSMPDFTSSEWQAVHTKAQLKKTILHGKNAMPGYKGDLEGLTADEIIRYLRKFAKKQ